MLFLFFKNKVHIFNVFLIFFPNVYYIYVFVSLVLKTTQTTSQWLTQPNCCGVTPPNHHSAGCAPDPLQCHMKQTSSVRYFKETVIYLYSLKLN